jgi:hypothetical protein
MISIQEYRANEAIQSASLDYHLHCLMQLLRLNALFLHHTIPADSVHWSSIFPSVIPIKNRGETALSRPITTDRRILARVVAVRQHCSPAYSARQPFYLFTAELLRQQSISQPQRSAAMYALFPLNYSCTHDDTNVKLPKDTSCTHP